MLPSISPQTRPTDGANAAPFAGKENRRIQRISLPLPVRVEVKMDTKTGWNEVTRFSDVSAFGAGFVLKRPVKRGRLVQLTAPMPRQLRSFDFTEPQYRVWALVRRCIATGRKPKEPEYSIGVAFIGKTPPASYLENPSLLYDLVVHENNGNGFWHIDLADLRGDESHLPKDHRRHTRYSIQEQLTIKQLDESDNVLFTETTVTENISLGGAAVFSTLQAETGAFVRVRSEVYDVEIMSVVRGSRVGADGITRLHLEFIDQFFPLEGIE